MEKESQKTTDHDTIRKWVEERNGKPATVKNTQRTGEKSGILRIDFPGYSGKDTLEEITWEEFFRKFEESNLAFLYQENLKDGEQSRFFRFVNRNSSRKE